MEGSGNLVGEFTELGQGEGNVPMPAFQGKTNQVSGILCFTSLLAFRSHAFHVLHAPALSVYKSSEEKKTTKQFLL